ncbi:DUF481 domain-containing protein [Adhaeribacter soli]|uniref:DUF481 domain-containing protein n=1 Tax=Adhaeribacter soli TaxID=2607655 RepID=A0A5N1IIA2_9BACT|nr:DUF481 domain-containing protein [Adhaeribacter soli]KAA9325393.1 DUF481 domain-containing protein [Adhaeribacter soli]
MQFFSLKAVGLLVLVFAFQNVANAQIVNIEQGRSSRDSSNFFAGKFTTSFSLYNQNAGKNRPNNYLQLSLNGDVAYNSVQHTYLLLNYYNYLLVNYSDKTQRKTIAKQGYSHFRVNLHREQRLSYEMFGQGQIEKARGLELRTLAGGYLRFRLMKNFKDVNVYLGTGLMHEHEEWENPEAENRLVVSDMLKTTNYVSARTKLQSNVEASAIIYYQTGYAKAIDDFRNRISGDVGLDVKLGRFLAFRTSFNCAYEDEPVVPVTKFVYAIRNGLTVAF